MKIIVCASNSSLFYIQLTECMKKNISRKRRVDALVVKPTEVEKMAWKTFKFYAICDIKNVTKRF